MAINGITQSPASGNAPIVFMKDGGIFASSKDVAEFFKKQHKHALEAIDTIISDAPEARPHFRPCSYRNENNREFRCYDMDRDGFTLLAMGFTGAEALKWKLRYIAAFNAMESVARQPDAALSVPQTYGEALRLAADLSDKNQEQAKQLEDMRPSVEAFDRIASADGIMCVTDAAKTLQVKPSELFKYLRTSGWVYKRPGTTEDVAYQSKLQADLLEHKVTTITRDDGSERVVTQVRVTAKGLARLAKEMAA